MLKDIKYLIAYIAPVLVFLGIYWGGYWSFGVFFLAYMLVPALELILPYSDKNLEKEEEISQSKRKFFNFLLYINLPLQFGLILYFLYTVATRDLMGYELFGMIVNVGIMNGYCINVAHEIGHRNNVFDRVVSELMLLPNLYMHFIIEHNFGHHKNVSTDLDPASSKKGDIVYFFIFKSIYGGYRNAWKIERNHLKRAGHSFFSIRNKMLWFHLIEAVTLVAVWQVFGLLALGCFIATAFLGVALLETINYVEHYGLRRKLLPNGRYETVKPHHSWNSNHELGRIFLFELPRHSDHHYKADRKYQVLRHFDEAPQLPLGYPGSMILSWFPPLWFAIMDKEVDKYMGEQQERALATA